MKDRRVNKTVVGTGENALSTYLMVILVLFFHF